MIGHHSSVAVNRFAAACSIHDLQKANGKCQNQTPFLGGAHVQTQDGWSGQEEQNKDQHHDESETGYRSFALLDAVAAGNGFVPIKGNGSALPDEQADQGYGGEHADGSHANACGLQFRSRK